MQLLADIDARVALLLAPADGGRKAVFGGLKPEEENEICTTKGGYLEKRFGNHFSVSFPPLPRQQGSCSITVSVSSQKAFYNISSPSSRRSYVVKCCQKH